MSGTSTWALRATLLRYEDRHNCHTVFKTLFSILKDCIPGTIPLIVFLVEEVMDGVIGISRSKRKMRCFVPTV
jgi:hypothetical protein